MERVPYSDILKKRANESRVYRKHQMTGLLIAQLLKDEAHKSLYMKLAKNHSESKLLGIARDVAERGPVKNKGAYFMSIIARLGIHYKKKLKSPKHIQLELKLKKARKKSSR